ncbi:MAG: type I DNA topoisomerase [Alphaproteobacteria bacterium]|nr:type I DNA topoisomerase [Alphaproteobacteria bacterium]MCL2889636.1 type I DNA topoisomerase [Alphaproteobacteria bacterium]
MKLLIVESPAKSKTIEKYLGNDWKVLASVGHVRDLVPEEASVDVNKDFAMTWQIMPGKEKQIKLIADAMKKADALYLATDPDREGEAISWHVLDILNERGVLKDKPIYRVVFNEITKKAVTLAIENPREIDQNLVDAYLVRRALDFLIGFKLSPVLWRRNLGKSAGRVQSVAVSLVVAREREIEAFKPVEYWSLGALCAPTKLEIRNSKFEANLTKFNSEKIDKLSIENKEKMFSILQSLSGEYKEPDDINRISNLESRISASVVSVEKKKTSRKPAAPFTTSTLQQEAARKLRFSSKRTMGVAQKLYEQGYITYMRTDATTLSSDAVAGIREFIGAKYGDAFLPKSPIVYTTKSKNAQEAHEAIRPTDANKIGSELEGDEYKLYDLIWKRAVACQMNNAEFDSVVVDLKTNHTDAVFHAVGTTRTFDGFMKVYIEDEDDKEDTKDGEAKLPPLAVGDKIDITKLLPEQHFTMPPPRYTEASLVKKLEELGIGRPSTYAAIMSTIVDREYVKIDKQRFFPTPSGWVVAAFLSRYFADIVAVDFTAKTEDTLDEVAAGEQKRLVALAAFWNPFSKVLASAKDVPTPEIIAGINEDLASHLFPDENNSCPECAGKLELKVSRYGAFLGCDKYPECKYTKNLSASDSVSASNTDDKSANTTATGNTDLGEDIKFLVGRFGPYVQQGIGKDAKRASAKQYNSETITLDIAKELLAGGAKAEPIKLGTNPATDKEILFYPTGRFGPYISSNKVNVSVKEQPDLDTAADLINNKKPSAKKAWGRKK